MKLDNGHLVCHGSMGHSAECKTVEYGNAAFYSSERKFMKRNTKENQNESLSDLKGRKPDGEQLEYQVDNDGGWTETECGHDFGKNYLSDDSEKAVQEFVAAVPPAHPYGKPQSFEDSVFYVDKSVMERELPEVVVYKENTYQAVKDICIDEGLPSQNKFLLDSDVDQKSLCTILHPEEEISTQKIKDKEDSDSPVPGSLESSIEKTDPHHCLPDGMKSSQENDCRSDACIFSDSKDSRQTGDEKDGMNKSGVNVLSKDNWSLGDLLSMPHWGAELSWPNSSSDRAEESKLQSSQRKRGNSLSEMGSACSEPQSTRQEVISGKPELVSIDEGSNHGVEEVSLNVPVVNSVACEPDHTTEELERDTASATLASEFKELENAGNEAMLDTDASHPDESTSSSTDELTRSSKAVTGSDNVNFSSSALVSNGEEPGPQKSDGGQPEAQTSSSLHSGADPSSNHPRYSQGETSFSASVPFSGLITYSGPIAYSGSLSIRSDSSTTSTRSFAFPVLQSEWNSSPVRMAKADRKRLSRHRRWKQSLLCCRF